jgi:hypothetical protein
MRDLGRHRGTHHCSLMSLTPITFDANTFSCCGGSYFATIAVFIIQLPKTSELGRAINAHITVIVYFRDHYHWFRVCSFAELSSAFIIPPPRALQLSTPTLPTFFSSELHHTSMGHARLVCTHLYIDTHLVEGRELQVPFFSNGFLYTVSFLLSLTTPFSIKKH